MPNSSKAVRSALMVARRAAGGSLSDAISSFSKDREAQFNRPSGNSDAALLAALQSQHPQLAVAEPPEQRKQSQASGVADLGAQIDEGAKWLSGTQDDDAPSVKLGTRGSSIEKNSASSQSLPTHPPLDAKAKDVDAYARQAALARGIDPDVASKFLGVESSYGQAYGGDKGPDGRPSSFGPFQLHYGGINPNMPHPGMGDDFTKATGLDARDPSTWKQQVDFALDGAAKGGWTPWTTTMGKLGYQPRTGLDSARPVPQPQQATAPSPAQPQDATGGPLSEADSMTNVNQAKRGGLMRRKHFDDGGDAGGDGGDGDGAAAAAAAAGFGGPGSAGMAAGFGASTSANGANGMGGFTSGMGGGNTGFGGSSATGTSVGFGSPGGASNAGAGNTGYGGGVGSHGGVSTAGVGGGAASGPGAAGPGGTGGGAGTAAGGNGFGGVPAFYNAGFGLGPGGRGNAAAAASDTATMRGLIGGVAPGIRGIGAGVAPGYGFAAVQGNDPGLAQSVTGQQALAQAAANGQQGITSQMAAAGMGSHGGVAAPGYSAQQVQALNALMAARGGQGFGNAGFGGGSPTASVGGFGGNSNSTGAEGVSTAGIGSPSAPSSPAQQAIAQAAANGQEGVTSQMAATGATAPEALAYAVNQAQQQGVRSAPQQQAPVTQAPAPAPHNSQERVQRGGYLNRANGGIASMPTDELIEMALQRIRQRRASGGTTNQDNFNAIAKGNPRGAAQLANMNTVSAINGVNTNGTPNVTQVPNYFYGMSSGANSDTPAPPPAAPANTPAIPSGVVGNHGGIGSPGFNSGAPIGGVPNASPNGQQTSSTDPNGPQYNNTLDQALQTNSPTSDEIFGFTYPTPPPPKPQPQGPVSQSMINELSGIGQGAQLFASGGAIIMDAALNKARKAIKGNKRNV